MTPAELARARADADDYVAAAAASKRPGGAPLPPDFSGNGEGDGKGYGHGFAWGRGLESLIFHRATWPVYAPRFAGRRCRPAPRPRRQPTG